MRPGHVAIIMDGNGRWAGARNQDRIQGHRRGIARAREIVRASGEYRISMLTLFAFSSENWQRPRLEVRALLDLFARALRDETAELIENNVKLCFIGDLSAFGKNLRAEIERAEKATADLGGLRLNIAINYGGRWDLAEVVGRLLRERRGGMPDNRTIQEYVTRHLAAADVDLVIRTGGESRISNFLLWQSAYAELYFTPTLWPEFGRSEYDKALAWFEQRERRFGAVPVP